MSSRPRPRARRPDDWGFTRSCMHGRGASSLSFDRTEHARGLSMVRAAGMAVGAGMAAGLLANGAAPARAARSDGALAPAARSRPLSMAYTPAPQPPKVEANRAQLHERLSISMAREPQRQL